MFFLNFNMFMPAPASLPVAFQHTPVLRMQGLSMGGGAGGGGAYRGSTRAPSSRLHRTHEPLLVGDEFAPLTQVR